MTPQFKGRLKRAYDSLTDEQKQEVTQRYQRHVRACRKADCQPELMFVFECVEELAAGRGLEAEEVRRNNAEGW